jgi:hydrogenase maturation protease
MSQAHAHSASSHTHDKTVGIDTVEHLVEHLGEIVRPTTAIVCVGNELCGDDIAGVEIARRLKDAVPWDVYDVQTVPESFLMRIISRDPESLLLVDALDFGAPVGSVEIIQAESVGGQGPGTHGPAPLAFLEIFRMMHPCPRAVLGIQPGTGEIGSEMTEPVRSAIDMVVEAFAELAGREGS